MNPSRVRGFVGFVLFLALLAMGCKKRQEPPADHPRLTPKVTLRDVTFYSVALNREMPYRVILPASIPAGQRLPLVYLLHGDGGGFRDWSNHSDVAQFVDRGEAKRGVTTIHLCLLDPLIRQEHHISFFHAASKKDCYPLIVNLRLCSIDATFNSSFTLAQEVTTGTNGTGLCLASFKASWTT